MVSRKAAKPAKDLSYRLSPDYVPTKEKLAYGCGAFMDGGGVALMSCVMLKYMTTMGIAMSVASTIMLVAKFWDAITDPVMGFISANLICLRAACCFSSAFSLCLCPSGTGAFPSADLRRSSS